MSKSRKNIVDPDDIIAHYGADCARWFMLSDSPPERDVIWTEAGVDGAGRFMQRVWRLVDEGADTAATTGTAKPAAFGPEATALRRAAHKTLDQVARTIEGLRFNVAVAQIYEFTNVLGSALGKAGEDLAWALREAARVAGADDRPDDAAFGRGMLGAARIQHPARQSSLAGGRAGLAR